MKEQTKNNLKQYEKAKADKRCSEKNFEYLQSCGYNMNSITAKTIKNKPSQKDKGEADYFLDIILGRC